MFRSLRILGVVAIAMISYFNAQAQAIWQDYPVNEFTQPANTQRTIQPVNFRAVKLNTSALLGILQTAPMEFTDAARKSPLVMSFPMPDGSNARFEVVQSPIMEAGLQQQFPSIRTYSGQGVDDRTATLRMDWTEFGFHAQVLSGVEGQSFYIDPFVPGETTQYMVYTRNDLPVRNRVPDQVIEEQLGGLTGLAGRTSAGPCLGGTLRTYRLAVACTGEYAAALQATTTALALSAVTTTVNRVNGVFEKELSVRLTLVANNSSILFTDAATDPFNGNTNANVLINESQTQIDNIIGAANYDIGHTFSTGAGGLAQLGAVCSFGTKARGVTGSTTPRGDAYDIDYVAHEIGHQFGGSHTFNAETGSCGGGNRASIAAVEPGSGITIMGYAGICGATNNLATNSIPFFHAKSQEQIGIFVTTGGGSFCGTSTTTGNAVPVVNAGPDYIIPRSTPFMLTGSATDANNSDLLTYSWEQTDLGTAGDWNAGNKPYFRTFRPALTGRRTFPRMEDVISGVATIGEILPAFAQTLNFTLTARDNRNGGGAICSDDMTLTIANTGPFEISSQWSNEIWTANGTNTATIIWNVAGTNTAPINCANVSILFSTDGGLTFPHTLVASTPNDGTETIVIPNLKTTQGRIMVRAVGNVFFNINTANLTVNSACAADVNIISPTAAVTGLAGNASLNLSLNAYSSFVPAGTITDADPFGLLAIQNTSTSGCASAGNQFKFHSYTFRVTTSGTYTFAISSASSGTMLANLYTNSFTPTSPCTNFLTSTATWPGSGSVTLNASMSRNLTAGTTYVLVVGTFSQSTPLPLTYRMTITPPAGGVAFQGGAAATNPGAGFNLLYVVVNNATGNIVSIGSSDLSNINTFPPGQYSVWGLSASASIANLNSFVGGSFTALQNQIIANPATFCADLSENAITVNALGTFPVQFTGLKARKQGAQVRLNWGTVTEQNSSHFVVQRSANGTSFETSLGRVQAAGNSNTERNYTLTDANPLKGWNYYRIQQFDLDGKFMFSNIAAVNLEKAGTLMLVYPNPAKDQLNLEYTAVRSGKLELQIIDSKGAVLLQEYVAVSAGRNVNTLNVGTLSQGVYILKYVDADGNSSFTRFVKQ